MTSRVAEILDIAKASSVSILLLIAVSYFIRRHEFSRLILLYFWILSIIMLSFARGIFREFLRFMRKKGYNIKYALIVGTGNLAEGIVKKIELHPELGVTIVGFLEGKSEILKNNRLQPKIIGGL